MQQEYQTIYRIVELIAEDDLVALHTHQTLAWNDSNMLTMDFFRFEENGKIVEHWDSIRQIPKESANEYQYWEAEVEKISTSIKETLRTMKLWLHGFKSDFIPNAVPLGVSWS